MQLKINSISFNNWESFIPDVVIFHNAFEKIACPDGIASAWVIWHRFNEIKNDIQFIGMNYKEVASFDWDSFKYQSILIVDFSIPLELVEKLEETNLVVIIDHHASFKEDFNAFFQESISSGKSYNFSNYVFDESKCAAKLCWEIFFPDEKCPTFLEYINDRDMFFKKLPDSDIIHLSMGMGGNKFPRNFDHFSQMYYDELSDGYQYVKNYLYPVGKFYWDKRQEQIKKIIDNPKKFYHWGKVPVIQLNQSEMSLKSDISEYVMKNLPNSHQYYFCILFTQKDKRIRVKTDTELDINLLNVFKDLQATGHKQACGFDWTNSLTELRPIVERKFWECF